MTTPPAGDEVAFENAHDGLAQAFARDDVVAFYATFNEGLLPCEEYVFARAIAPGARVLDLGVGAGRTTGYLAARASRYVGLDYSSGMIAACEARYPGLEFVVGDASDLSRFGAGSFDAVVFSFNGLDCLHPDAARLRSLAEIRRVLAPGGIAVLSSHNPRALVARPRPWRGVNPKLGAARLARAARTTIDQVVRLGPTPTLRTGIGYYFDPEHGGVWLHAATPARFVAEVEAAGFTRVGEIIGVDHPRRPHAWSTGWYYYTFQT